MNISDIEKQIAALTSQLKVIKAEQEAKDLHTIGGMFRHQRMKAGLQQREVAVKINTSPSVICSLEKNKQATKMTTFLSAIKAIGMKPSAFFAAMEEHEKNNVVDMKTAA